MWNDRARTTNIHIFEFMICSVLEWKQSVAQIERKIYPDLETCKTPLFRDNEYRVIKPEKRIIKADNSIGVSLDNFSENASIKHVPRIRCCLSSLTKIFSE